MSDSICDLNIKRWQVFNKYLKTAYPNASMQNGLFVRVLFLLSFFKSRLGKNFKKNLDITCTRIKKATATCIYKLVFRFSHQFRFFVNRS